MKRIITIFSLLIVNYYSAQIAPPSIEDAKKRITENSQVVAEIEEKMGTKITSLTIESDKWIGYEGSTFSLTRATCGQQMGLYWPDDALYTKFNIQSKKNKEGVYRGMGVYVFYKRSSQRGDICYLTNEWTYWDYRLEGMVEYGYKEFNKEEAQKIFLDYVNTNKPNQLNDFIEITKVDFENFGQSSESAAAHYLSFYFKGTRAILTDDQTTILGTSDVSRVKFILKVEKVGDAWKATNFGIYDAYSSPEKRNLLSEIQYMDKAEDNFKTFKNGGWEAIYPKRTSTPKVSGELEVLNERIKSFMELLLVKKVELTESDLANFIAPSKSKEFNDWFAKNYNNAEKRMELVSYDYKESFPIKIKNEDGSFTKIAFPELTAKYTGKVKKGKKWKDNPSHCSSCNKRSPKDVTTTYHPMVWLFENNNWYLYNPSSIFMENEEKIEIE